MQIIRNPQALSPSVATIGFFDGVHLGHRYLIEQVRIAARERGVATSVVTFPVHPRQVMHPDFRPTLLTTCEEKLKLLEQTGVDRCVMIDFTTDVARLSAREFMAILKEQYGIAALVIGYDHRFGHNRSEGFQDYVRYGQELGMEVVQAGRLPAPLTSCFANAENPPKGGTPYTIYNSNIISSPFGIALPRQTGEPGGGVEGAVSSSAIRNLLHEGNVSKAARLLGYDYFLQGTVVGGYHVGRKIGYPTANLHVADTDKLIPADGVYAVRVSLEGKEYGGMCSIGCRPTLENGSDRSIEVHIFDYHGDAYRQPMRLSFVRRTRAELKFDTVEALIAQLHQDETEIKRILYE